MSKNLTLNTACVTKRASFLLLFALMTAVVAGDVRTASGQQRTSPTSASNNRSSQQTGKDATTVFRAARDLITDGEWAKAQEKFSEYVSSFPNEKNLDAALYWLAYTQHKLAKYDQCRSTIDRLLEKFPNTSWKEDARMLLAQVPGGFPVAAYQEVLSNVRAQAAIAPPALEAAKVWAPGVPPMAITPQPAQAIPQILWALEGPPNSADDDDPCEFKIVVLQALFQTDPQRGIVAATDWLKPGSTQTVRCKSAALTLLGRNGGKAVTPVILGVARNEPDLKLRARAISALGSTNDDSVIDALRDFALNSQDSDIVEASLYALSKHTSDRAITVLSDIAISGKMTAQRKVAIASIASRAGEPAVDALFRIYDADQNVEIRKAVIGGFANRKSERAGNKLFEIARSSDNIELRKAAISALSRRGGDKTVEFLLSLYDTEKNEELKDQIINSLGYGSGIYIGTPTRRAPGQPIIAGGAGASSRMNDDRVIQKFIEIAKDPQAPMERRKRAIGWLSRSNDPKVIKFLEDLLK
jgi:tetratricopeptide (TPR) repeat protein